MMPGAQLTDSNLTVSKQNVNSVFKRKAWDKPVNILNFMFQNDWFIFKKKSSFSKQKLATQSSL